MTLNDIKNDAEILISSTRIDQAILELSQRLNRYYSTGQFAQQPITAYCVMNGGLYFTGQLMRHLNFPLTIKYLHASRYGDKTQGANLSWSVQPNFDDVQGKDILLIDDIFDEGQTLEAIYQECTRLQPKSIHSVVLVDKCHQRKPSSGFSPDFIGLEVEDKYIFGCGMDYKGLWRNLPAIYALKR